MASDRLIGYYYHEDYTDLIQTLIYYNKDDGISTTSKKVSELDTHTLISGGELEEFKQDKKWCHKYSVSELVNIMMSEYGDGVDVK